MRLPMLRRPCASRRNRAQSLGACARFCADLLSKDYKTGKSTVELKTKTPAGLVRAAATRPAGLQPLAPVRPLVPLDNITAASAARTTEGQVARAGVRREKTDVEPAL